MTNKAYNIQKDGYLYLTGISDIDGLLWASEEETSPDEYVEFYSESSAQAFIIERDIENAELVECEARWA